MAKAHVYKFLLVVTIVILVDLLLFPGRVLSVASALVDYDSYIFSIGNEQYSYTGYRYSTRTTWQQAVPGAWSDYSDAIPPAGVNNEIQTRVLYRSRTVNRAE